MKDEQPIPADLVGPDQPPFTSAELATALDYNVDETDPEVPERVKAWAIQSTGEAAWAMSHVAEARAAIAAVQDQYDEWAERLARWRTEAVRTAERTERFFTGHLQLWALELRTDKVKTFQLPAGEVKTRKGSVRVEVADEDALFDWLDGPECPWGDDDADRPVAPWVRKINLTNLRSVFHVKHDVPAAAKTTDPDTGEIVQWSLYGLTQLEPPPTGAEVTARLDVVVFTDDDGRDWLVPGVSAEHTDPTATVVVS